MSSGFSMRRVVMIARTSSPRFELMVLLATMRLEGDAYALAAESGHANHDQGCDENHHQRWQRQSCSWHGAIVSPFAAVGGVCANP